MIRVAVRGCQPSGSQGACHLRLLTQSLLSIQHHHHVLSHFREYRTYRIDPVQSGSYLEVGVICEKDLVAFYVSATRIRIDRGARLNPPGLMSLTNTSSPSMSTQPHVKSGH